MENALALLSALVVFATVAVIIDLMNDPPIISINKAGNTAGLYGKAPSVKYPALNKLKASIIALRNPIRSANAPVKVGSKYNPEENTPPIQAAQISLKPTTRVRYKVIAMKTA